MAKTFEPEIFKNDNMVTSFQTSPLIGKTIVFMKKKYIYLHTLSPNQTAHFLQVFVSLVVLQTHEFKKIYTFCKLTTVEVRKPYMLGTNQKATFG